VVDQALLSVFTVFCSQPVLKTGCYKVIKEDLHFLAVGKSHTLYSR